MGMIYINLHKYKNLKMKYQNLKTKFEIMVKSFSQNEYLFIFICALLPSLGVGILLFKEVFYVKESIDVFIETHTSTQYFNTLVDLQKELLQAKAEEALLKAELAQLKAQLSQDIHNLKVDLEYSQRYEQFLVVSLSGIVAFVTYTQ